MTIVSSNVTSNLLCYLSHRFAKCAYSRPTSVTFVLPLDRMTKPTLVVVFLSVARSDVVPIVMGARPIDYERHFPPGSYIHVDDFRTPKDLADYLHLLDQNDTQYNAYFAWKDQYVPIVDRLEVVGNPNLSRN